MRALFITVAAFAVYVLIQDIDSLVDAAAAFGKHPLAYLEGP